MCHWVQFNLNSSVNVSGRTDSKLACTVCVCVWHGEDITSEPDNHTQDPHKSKTKHGYTAVSGPSTSKIQAAKQ